MTKFFGIALVGVLFLIAPPVNAAEFKVPESYSLDDQMGQTMSEYLMAILGLDDQDEPEDGSVFTALRNVQRTVIRNRGAGIVGSLRANRVNRVNVRVNLNARAHVQDVQFANRVQFIRTASIAYAYQPHIAVQAHYAAYDPCAVPVPVPVPIENQSSQQTERLIQALGAHAQAMASHGQAIESLHRTLKGPAPKQE